MSVQFKDYYQILGLERGASDDDIRKSYRKLARKYHPDVSKDAKAEDRFKEVSEAYEVLRDPEKRRKYDQLGHNWKQGQDFRPPPGFQGGAFNFGNGSEDFQSFGGFSDFFETLFGGAARGQGGGARSPFGGASGFTQHAQRATKGEDHQLEIEVSLEEAANGSTRVLQIERPVMTPQGARGERQSVNVRIPKGVSHGARIRLAGQGQPSARGGESGDLFLRVKLLPHPRFEVDGHDLKCTVEISPWEAALGAKVTVPTLDGQVNMTVPPGSSSGRSLRLRGKGLPRRRGEPGDLFVNLRIVVPESLSSRERELFEQLGQESAFRPRR